MTRAGRLNTAVACPNVPGSAPAALICSSSVGSTAAQPDFIFSAAASAVGISIRCVP